MGRAFAGVTKTKNKKPLFNIIFENHNSHCSLCCLLLLMPGKNSSSGNASAGRGAKDASSREVPKKIAKTTGF